MRSRGVDGDVGEEEGAGVGFGGDFGGVGAEVEGVGCWFGGEGGGWWDGEGED